MTITPCAGCHVGPDDECIPGCPATLLVNVGWSPERAAEILAGPSGYPPRPPEQLALMTDDEHALMDALGDVSNRFCILIRPGDHHIAAHDWAEVASRIHDLQARVLAVAAARAFPGMYRSLVGRTE